MCLVQTEGRLADKIKKMLLMYPAWMTPVLRNVLHINECYFQATFMCCDIYRSTLCVCVCVWLGYIMLSSM